MHNNTLKNFKHTKIIATIGPATNSPEMIRPLIKLGINIIRINFSHLNDQYDTCATLVKSIRAIAAEEKRNIGILGDLQGPKIRIGKMKDDTMLNSGNTIKITTADLDEGDESLISTTYKDLPHDLKVGDKILVDDGLLDFQVTEVGNGIVTCIIINGGVLKSNKGINLPNVKLSTPALTEKDKRDLAFAIKQEFEFIALSFVRDVKDIKLLNDLIKKSGATLPIISKVEKPEAVANIDAIIDASFGIMIARGDLGVEMDAAMVPIIQKEITEKCNFLGKPTIIATQMLDSMQYNPRPTRAEASDVFNAVIDGADCLMLSGETASGKFPLEAVKTMREIIMSTEKRILQSNWKDVSESIKFRTATTEQTKLICRSAIRIAKDLNAELILCITHSGNTARQLSKYRPGIPIIAITEDPHVLRRLSISWGVRSYRVDHIGKDVMFYKEIFSVLNDLIHLNDGAKIVLTAALPDFEKDSTNMIKIHTHHTTFDQHYLIA